MAMLNNQRVNVPKDPSSDVRRSCCTDCLARAWASGKQRGELQIRGITAGRMHLESESPNSSVFAAVKTCQFHVCLKCISPRRYKGQLHQPSRNWYMGLSQNLKGRNPVVHHFSINFPNGGSKGTVAGLCHCQLHGLTRLKAFQDAARVVQHNLRCVKGGLPSRFLLL